MEKSLHFYRNNQIMVSFNITKNSNYCFTLEVTCLFLNIHRKSILVESDFKGYEIHKKVTLSHKDYDKAEALFLDNIENTDRTIYLENKTKINSDRAAQITLEKETELNTWFDNFSVVDSKYNCTYRSGLKYRGGYKSEKTLYFTNKKPKSTETRYYIVELYKYSEHHDTSVLVGIHFRVIDSLGIRIFNKKLKDWKNVDILKEIELFKDKP
jgi:hypothetical protein